MADGPYVKVYHELRDLYPEVWDTPLLGDYVRLLVAADQAWPSRAIWAGHATRRSIQQLATIGADDDRGALVFVDGSRFAIRGLDKERQSRSQSAAHAARTRWSDAPRNAPRNADGNAETMPPKAKQSKAEQSREILAVPPLRGSVSATAPGARDARR